MPKSPLTIVIVLDHANVTGGQAKVAFDSAKGLKAAGHNPIVFAAAGPVDASMLAQGIEVVCLGQTDLIGNASKAVAAMQGVWNFAAARALKDLLARVPRGASIVHVHGWAKALSPAIAGPIVASGLPAVYTIHEYFLFCPNGGFYNYQKAHVCPLEPMSLACLTTHCDSRTYPRKLWRSARQFVLQHVARLPDVFSDYITISKFQEGVVAGHLPKGVRLHDVSNPIEAEDLGPKPDPLAGEIIFVGRISPEKGPFLFAQAARQAGLVPVFVGDGPVAGELAERYPEARILGWKSPAEVKSLMRAARALVFPSLWYEGQPLTVLEAKGMGTPVIVADGCAGREEIEDGVAGLWFKMADAESLANALRRAKDDVLIRQLSAGAYNSFWSNPPTLQRHVGAIVGIYADMLERAGSRVAA